MSLRKSVLLMLGLLVGWTGAAEAASFKGQTLRVQFWGGGDGLVIRQHIVDQFVKAVDSEGKTITVDWDADF